MPGMSTFLRKTLRLIGYALGSVVAVLLLIAGEKGVLPGMVASIVAVGKPAVQLPAVNQSGLIVPAQVVAVMGAV